MNVLAPLHAIKRFSLRFYAGGLIFFLSLIIICALYIDKPLSLYFRFLTTTYPTGKKACELITMAGLSWIYLIPTGCIFLLSWVLYKQNAALNFGSTSFKNISIKSAYFFLCVALSGLSNNLIKMIVGRSRPKLLDQQDLFSYQPFTWASDWNSFPSGHSTNAFAAAMAASYLFPRYRFIAFFSAFAVSCSRFILNAHYLSDVIAGAIWGILFTYFLTIMADKANRHLEHGINPTHK